jgi:hypothetical protein
MSDGNTPVPVISIGKEDEAGVGGLLARDNDKNYANNEMVQDYIREHVWPAITYARLHRKTIEEEWREIRRMTLLEHDSNRKYKGRSEAYMPIYLRNLRTLVSQTSRGMFPSDEYMDVISRQGDPERGQPIKDYIQYEFEKCAKLRSALKPHLKQYFQFGWSVVKAWYHKELADKKPRKSLRVTNGRMFGERERDAQIEGLRVSTRSIFYFYVWPTTVDSLEDATLFFEDIDVPKWYIEEMGRKGKWENAQAALDAPFQPDHILNQQQMQEELIGNTTVPQSAAMGSDLSWWRTIQECWLKLPLPDDAYEPGETKGEPVLCLCLMAGDVPLIVRRNPYWHGRSPYLVSRLLPEVGAFYPKGDGYTAKYLQYMVNDTFNQVTDNLTYGLNPMTLMNPSTLVGAVPNFRPGGVIQTTDTQHGIRFDRPPVEQVQYGTNFGQMLVSMLSDTMGTPPIMQGSNAGKGARTATSSQILQKNAMNPIQDIVEDFENEILVELMKMAHSLGQQYRSDELFIPIVGGTPQRISPEQLIGDFDFRWLASSQAANAHQQSQERMQVLEVAMKVMPLLMQQGKTVNPEPLLKALCSAVGMRGYSQFIVPMPMPQGIPGQMPAPGGPPIAPAPGDANAGAAIPNGEPAPGEGADFGEMRDGADDMSAALGSMLGG